MAFFKDEVLRDVIASRPTTGPTTGALFFASDTGAAYRWNGASWDQVVTVPNFADNETPGGSVNGSNVTFTLAHTPSPAASLRLYIDGVHQTQGTDYTLSTATITMTNAPSTGDIIRAFYRY